MTETVAPELPPYPYLGLRSFDAADSLLYHGRDKDLRLCHAQLLNPAVRVFVLHGLSGSGKSSFLRAGLLPKLRANARSLGPEGGVIPITAVVTAGPHMLKHLAMQVYQFVIEGEGRAPWACQLAALKRFGTREGFIEKVAQQPGVLMEFIGELSCNPRYVALIAIDQVEEYFTGPGAANDGVRDAFLGIVDEFARERLNGKLILSLRTEQYGVFASRLPQSAQQAYAVVRGVQRVFHHYLANPKQEELLSLATAPAAIKGYNFRFEPGAAEYIVDHLTQAAADPEMCVLPLLQTVLLRLFLGARKATANQDESAVITRSAFEALCDRADGKGTGFISDFVDWGLSEAVRVVLGPDPGPQSQRMEASCWGEVLRAMSSRNSVGIRVRDRKNSAEIRLLSLAAECRADSDEMIRALTSHRIGLFSKVDADGAIALQHDIICLSFDLPLDAPPGFWVQGARRRRRRILEAADYDIDDLFDEFDKPATQTLAVSELRFWDHKSLAYADALGLFARLGLQVQVVPENEDILAKDLAHRLQLAGGHGVFSYPRVLMNGEELEVSQDIVVLNSFTGYAVICNRRAASVLPEFQEEGNWESFEGVCGALMQLHAAECHFEAEDDGARIFLDHLFEIYRYRTDSGASPAKVDARIIDESSKLSGVAFLDERLHTGDGPVVAVVTTPTWALATVDERNIRTVIDQRALLGLLDGTTSGLSPALATLRRKLEMRNVMNLKLGALPPGEDAEALKLRLVSVGLFVADCIWAQDREAGEWIRNRWMETSKASGQVSFPAFLRTFRRSYAYVTAQDHGRRYYGTAWDDDCPEALRLHQRWQTAQMSYERQLESFTTLERDGAVVEDIYPLIRRARLHAEIENYYDAERLMSHALKCLNRRSGVVEAQREGEIP